MTALVIGNDGKTEMKKGKDQFSVFEGVLSKSVNDKNCTDRILGLIVNRIQRASLKT